MQEVKGAIRAKKACLTGSGFRTKFNLLCIRGTVNVTLKEFRPYYWFKLLARPQSILVNHPASLQLTICNADRYCTSKIKCFTQQIREHPWEKHSSYVRGRKICTTTRVARLTLLKAKFQKSGIVSSWLTKWFMWPYVFFQPRPKLVSLKNIVWPFGIISFFYTEEVSSVEKHLLFYSIFSATPLAKYLW